MLPRTARLTRGGDITACVRGGTRAGRPGVTVHLLAPADGSGPARATVVTPRAVGSAVVRNRTRRRLRHLLAARLDRLPPGSALVVRADARAAALAAAPLAEALDGALRTALSRASRAPRPPA